MNAAPTARPAASVTIDADGFAERYRAVASRDRRFDGRFVTAVRTTGIYCRPSCPARTPAERNVTFFATSAAAHEAGYRACKRCLPEATPGSTDWNLRGDTAGRAMRLIGDGVIEREGVPGLARRLGYSSRQLARILAAELGASPLALARAHRAQTARALLVGTELGMPDIAFAAGFASVRQFNDTVREVFGLTPTAVRATRRGERAAPGPAGSITLHLPVREPFDASGVFAWMQARHVPGVEEATRTMYARALALPGGPAWFRVTKDAAPGSVRLEARLGSLADLPPLVTRVRRLFDLDADPVGVDGALAAIPELTGAVASTPGIRAPGASDPAEMLVRAMIGQQITVVAARTALTRLTSALGEAVSPPEGFAGLDRLFPTPAAIAESGAEVLRGPRARIGAVVEAAAALADGSLALSPADDEHDQRRRLLALRGVGPWTADYVRMRVTGDPDVLLPGDVALRSGAAALGIPSAPRELETWAERAAPWRSYLSAHLWRAAPARPAHRHPTTKASTP